MNQTHDIAVVVLNSTVPTEIKPICLAPEDFQIQDSSEVTFSKLLNSDPPSSASLTMIVMTGFEDRYFTTYISYIKINFLRVSTLVGVGGTQEPMKLELKS